jgi:hypothetical protein
LTSIYGIDISDDNVVESCERMRSTLKAHLDGIEVTDGFTEAVGVILSTNVQRADTLTDARRVQLVEYTPVGNGTFVRDWSYLEERKCQEFSLVCQGFVGVCASHPDHGIGALNALLRRQRGFESPRSYGKLALSLG